MTTSERYERLHQLFAATCELPPEQRAALLDRECASDVELRREVEALLAKDSDRKSFLESPALGDDFHLDGGPSPTEPDGSLVGQSVGHYRLTRVIAAGGMGTVYEAVQDKPKRTVAVKVMRRGIASRSALRRFEYEAQILARLRHPGIAQVFDAGSYGDGPERGGVPYFVMEYVAGGNPITEHAQAKGLSTRQRLKLFATVCDAVQHGHQRGIIHRDLKPANILVDAAGEPKIIDFGVARATDSDMAVTTLQTDVGQILGTLQYMSPEQCAASPHDLDTRSDVYALGVVLYELLCEQLPYDATRAGVPEALRVVREEVPARPSSINYTLRGDVETIVLKALEKDRDRRYQSSADFARDVRRYLNNEPIVARPPSAMYQLRKLIARHKVPFALIAALFVLTASSSIWMTVLYGQAGAERDEAESVTDFLADMLAAVRPAVAGKDVTLRELLDEAAGTIGEKFKDQPLVEARLRTTIGTSYQALGEYDRAEAHLDHAFEIRRQIQGEKHADTLGSLNDLAELYHRQDRLAEAEQLYKQTLETCERVLGEEHVHTLSAMRGLAHLYHHATRWDESELLYLRALDIAERVLGDEHPQTLGVMASLGFLYRARGSYDKAEPLLEQTLEKYRTVRGEEHVATASAMLSLARLYRLQDRLDEAEQLTLQVLKIRQRVQGDEHPDTAAAMHTLARVYEDQGRFEEAEALHLEALELHKRILGEGHRWTLLCMIRLGNLYASLGRTEEAEPLFAEAAVRARRVPPEQGFPGGFLMRYGKFLSELERYDEAEAMLLEGLEILENSPAPVRPRSLVCMTRLGELYTQLGRYDEAEPLLAEAVAGLRSVRSQGHWQIGWSLMIHGVCLSELKRYDEAEAALLEAHEILKGARGEDHDQTIEANQALVELYNAWDAAEPGEGYAEQASEWRAKLPAERQAPAVAND